MFLQAGKTMCLAGDSIDKQWFEVLGHQLHRAAYLASSPISSVWEGSIQLGDLGCNLDVPKWPGMMKDVGQLDALGKDGQRLARFRYFKFYQFIPGTANPTATSESFLFLAHLSAPHLTHTRRATLGVLYAHLERGRKQSHALLRALLVGC